MRFGSVPTGEAENGILAHSQKVEGKRFKKGRVLSADDITALERSGVDDVVIAQLDPSDVPEDEAAHAIAVALTGAGLNTGAAFTGRCNLLAAERSVLQFDRTTVDELNLIDEAITVATLPPWAVVDSGQMVATIKIIPFAVDRASLDRCLAVARGGTALTASPLQSFSACLVQTELPDTSARMLDKTREVMTRRLDGVGGRLVSEHRCAHDVDALKKEIVALRDTADILLVAGASAIVDRRDVIPAGIVEAGGEILHFGMPMDPGNLLLTARAGSTPVFGLPGCARSPKYNGLDAVLERFAAGIDIGGADIMRMGVGGLLKEFSGRPAPRAGADVSQGVAPVVDAVILAAGQSRRMGAENKLLADVGGSAMVKHVVEAVASAAVRRIVVVVGHESDQVRDALADYPVTFALNPAYDRGLSTSLRAGLAELDETADAVLVGLGDMPRIKPDHLDRLIAAFDVVEGREICAPVWQGKRGNPVLWARRFVNEMASVQGDTGARHLIGENEDVVCEVPMPDDAILEDIDTPEALASLRDRST